MYIRNNWSLAPFVGRVQIKPGLTGTQPVFLDYNLITVEWSVNETTIQDKYEIVLNTSFETNVPAAVVVMEPASTTLPDMKTGDVFYGEIKLSNYGLVRADALNFSLPQSDEYIKYEFMDGLPATLDAKASIIIPYRAVALKAIDPALDTAGSGGGCGTYSAGAGATYSYDCANGTTSSGGVSGGTSVGGGGGGGGGGGVATSGSASAQSMPGQQCVPRPGCQSGNCCGGPSGGGAP